jgi:two-component system LytT family response regulator
MIKAVIIDDEQPGIDRLSYLINNYCPDEIMIAGTANTVESGLELLKEMRPQLVFLDVEIGKLTGFDLLQRLGTIQFQVVFTTAFQQYAIQAFKFSAVDYMLKPIGPDELLQTVSRIREKMEKDEQRDKLEMLFQNMKQMNQQDPRVTVPTMSGLEILKVNDILRCQSDGNYTTIFMKDKTTIVVAKTLKEFEGLLSPYDFFRIHNSHLVNLAFIKSYHKGKGGYVRLEDKTELEVSSRRKDEFLLKLTSLK